MNCCFKIKHLLLISFTFLLTFCKKDHSNNGVYFLISEDSSILLDIKDVNKFSENLKNSDFNKIFEPTEYLDNLNIFKYLNSFDDEKYINSLLSVLNFSGAKKYEWVSAFYCKKFEFNRIATNFYKYQNTPIYGSSFKDNIFYLSHVNNTVIFSKNKLLIEDAIRQIEKKESIYYRDKNLNKILNKKFNDENITFAININSFQDLLDSEFIKKIDIKNSCEWIICDIQIKKNQIFFTGITDENKKNFLNIIKNQSKSQITIDKYFPSNTSWFFFQNISDFKSYKKDYDFYLESNNQKGYSTRTIIQKKEFFKKDDIISFFDNEMAILFQNEKYEISEKEKGISLILNIKDNNILIEKLNPYTIEYENIYKNVTIKKINENIDFKESFGNLAKDIKAPFYAIYNNIIIFSNYEVNIKEIITDHLEKKSLSENTEYKKFKSNFKNYNALLFISNLFLSNANTNKILNNNNSLSKYLTKIKDNIFNLHFMGMEFVSTNSNTIVSGSLYYYSNGNSSLSSNNIWSTEIKNEVLGAQALLKNHKTKTLEYFFQDKNYNINLLNAKGALLWSRNIKEKILGKPKQIDIFKNGKYQTVFSTNNKIYLIDIFGRDVDGFPIKIDGGISQPINIFDYEMDSNYRIAVVSDKKIYMYDKTGKRIKDFSYNGNYSIASEIKYAKIKSKDYLYFTESNGKLKVINRLGKDRIKYQGDYILSNKGDVFFIENESNYISGFTENGSRIHFYLDGTYKKFDKDMFENIHYYKISNNYELVYYNKNIYFMSKNTFYTYKISQNVDILGAISYNKKDYVYIVDKNRESVFILNEKGNLENGFPIHGSTDIVAGSLNKNSHNIITSNGNYVYCFNL